MTTPTSNGGPSPLPTYRLTLRALPCEVPAVQRLRAVLKRLLRTFKFRCVDVQELKDGIEVSPDLGDEE
jgi:hypothetical protein